MSDFQVTLKVTSSRLATVLEALKGAAELLSVLPCEEAEARVHKKKSYANGKRDKGIRASELVLTALSSGVLTVGQLTSIFIAKGFAENSVSPALSELNARGLVESPERGCWRLTGAGRLEHQKQEAAQRTVQQEKEQ